MRGFKWMVCAFALLTCLALTPPSASAQEFEPAANRPGLRHISFGVEDLHGIVQRVRAAGWEPVGEIVNYEDLYLLCYIRGPEGLIVELAESIGGAGQSSSTGVT